MSRRRSLRHLIAIAAGGGLITLAVAITGITPVWLAVGPLLLVALDTIAYSTIVRSRLSPLGAALLRPASQVPGWGGSPYRSTLRAELRMARDELDLPFYRRFFWEVDVLRYYLPAVALPSLLSIVVGLGVTLVVAGTSGVASHPGAPVGIVLTSLGGIFLSTIALAYFALLRGPTIHYAASPVRWLQDEMDAAEDAMPLLVFSFSAELDAASVGALVTLAIPRSRGRALVTLDHKLLVTGSVSDLARLLDALPAHIPSARRAEVRVGRAEYPQDGTTPEALLSAATARLAPLDETDAGPAAS
jgi:hypothetical protein